MDEFPAIWFKLDNHWYQYAPTAYLEVMYEDFEYNTVCSIQIRKSHYPGRDFGVLGINFLENYLQWHDIRRNTVCLKEISFQGGFYNVDGIP